MKNLRHLLLASTIFTALICAPYEPAKAAFGQYLCSPSPVDQFSARTIGGSNTFVPSGTLYLLNGQGCAFIAQQDVGAFQAQGFTGGQNFFTVTETGLTANSVSGSTTLTVPAGTYIHNIVIQNTTTNAVTGGVNIGTTASATDIAATIACTSTCLIAITDSALSKRIFSTSASQQIFFTAASSFNSANLSISVLYSYF